MVKDFPCVFSKDLPTLPLDHEIEFSIDLILRTSFISKTQHQMTKIELVEFNEQLQELLDKGVIRLNVSPWRALILFMKKKDNTMWLCTEDRQLN